MSNHKRPEVARRAAKKHQRKLRLLALAALGGKCVRCGYDDPRALQIDHIEGGGGTHMRAVNWDRRYKDLIRGYITGFQLLCANCNWIKRDENNEVRSKEHHSHLYPLRSNEPLIITDRRGLEVEVEIELTSSS